MKQLVSNCIMCPCDKEEVICSMSRNDFKYCSCGKVAVDCGLDYAKRMGEDFTEMAVWEDFPDKGR